jgi:hypothetical protein
MKIHIELDTLVSDDLAAVLRLLKPTDIATPPTTPSPIAVETHTTKPRSLTKRAIELLDKFGSGTIDEMSDILKVTRKEMVNCIAQLRNNRLVESNGQRGKPGARYWLKSKGDDQLAAALPVGTKVAVMR